MQSTTKIYQIVEAVSVFTNVSVSDILSNSREGRIVKARHIIMWISRYYTKTSLQTIASVLNCKRHATVIHGAKQIDDYFYTDKAFGAELKQFAQQFNN